MKLTQSKKNGMRPLSYYQTKELVLEEDKFRTITIKITLNVVLLGGKFNKDDDILILDSSFS